jgi:hypothetical protein
MMCNVFVTYSPVPFQLHIWDCLTSVGEAAGGSLTCFISKACDCVSAFLSFMVLHVVSRLS